MTSETEEFQCANCKRKLKSRELSELTGSHRWLLFSTLGKVLPVFNKTNEICKGCTRQVYIWFLFVTVIVIAAPYLDALRSAGN